ncbi:DUF3581 domain-containing protein [Halomonas shantousis]
MFLDNFHTRTGERIAITAEQASRFAKCMADDYNPIHDPGARRFCVPGDLLFALVLARHGLSQHMSFHFCGMVGDGASLSIHEHADNHLSVSDDSGKKFLHVEREGEIIQDTLTVESFIRRYIAFSGRNFPHYLKPLMEEHGVMFNPQRPLVIYDRMDFMLETLDIAELQVEFADSRFHSQGRRGEALLEFRMKSQGRVVGRGSKTLIVSGLQTYDAALMDAFVEEFNRRKLQQAN